MKKTMGFQICLITIAILTSTSAWAKMHYLHVAGNLSVIGQDQLATDIKTKLSGPLDAQGTHLTKYYQWVAESGGGFYFNVVLESADRTGEAFLNSYIPKFQTAGFDGIAIKFQDVKEIVETVDLVAGKHRTDSTDNSFDADSETPKDFTLTSVKDWEAFTDKIGFALADKDHGKFINYLHWFFQTHTDYHKYSTEVLNHDDLLLAELTPTIVLDDGTRINSETTTPFFDMPFARNCWMPEYENGVCEKQKNAR